VQTVAHALGGDVVGVLAIVQQVAGGLRVHGGAQREPQQGKQVQSFRGFVLPGRVVWIAAA
jgi:hypothetical protein